MTAKKRKPKAITPKRVTTEATKAKLPRPKRKRKPKRVDAFPALMESMHEALEHAQNARKERDARAIPCGEDAAGNTVSYREAPPQDWWGAQDHRPDCPEAREFTGKPCGCGEDAPPASDSWVAGHKAWQAKAGIPEVVTTVDGLTWSNASTTSYVLRFPNGSTHDLPVTEPYPWPVRVLNWVDAAPAKVRRRIAAWLRALARKVEPT